MEIIRNVDVVLRQRYNEHELMMAMQNCIAILFYLQSSSFVDELFIQTVSMIH